MHNTKACLDTEEAEPKFDGMMIVTRLIPRRFPEP